MVKKRIVIGSLLLLGMIGLGVTYLAVVKENDSSQDDAVTIDVKRYDYSDSQYEDNTQDFYEYEIEGNDTAEIEVKRLDYSDSQIDHGYENADLTEDIYEYEYEDDDTAEIEVKRLDYTQ